MLFGSNLLIECNIRDPWNIILRVVLLISNGCVKVPRSPLPCASMFQRSVTNLVFNERLIENDSPSTLQMISVKYCSVLRSNLSITQLETVTFWIHERCAQRWCNFFLKLNNTTLFIQLNKKRARMYWTVKTAAIFHSWRSCGLKTCTLKALNEK